MSHEMKNFMGFLLGSFVAHVCLALWWHDLHLAVVSATAAFVAGYVCFITKFDRFF